MTSRRWSRPLTAAALALLASARLATAEPPADPAPPPPAIDPAAAAGVFAEGAALCKADGGRLWGVSLCGPLLLVDPTSRAVVADRAAGTLAATSTPGVWAGTLPPEIAAANTATDWAGERWTMLLWPLPGEPAARARLIAHELFHRVQDQLGVPLNNPDNAHLDDGPGRFWLRLELAALAGAMRSEDAAGARAAARDALLFRQRRHQLVPAAAPAAEAALERNEGVAEYTGVALAWQDAAARGRAVAERIDKLPTERSLVRSFAYGTGAAYGLLLDAADPGWRTKVRAGAEPATLLAAALAVPPSESVATIEARAATWGAATIRPEEAARDRDRAARRADYRARLVEGPVLVLPMESTSVSFDPRAVLPLGEAGTVHPTLRLSAAWGILEVTDGAALMAPDWSRVTVPAPPPEQSSTSNGPGWVLTVKPGWEVVPGGRPGDFVMRASPPAKPAESAPPPKPR